MSTPHNAAQAGQIAPVVLMPGDPLRAAYIAQNFLENPVEFNHIRNMYGYTGEYKGKRISVMGSGMGMPSMGIYSYELYKFYDVQAIIRIGSAGGYTKDLHVFDLMLTKASWSTSTYAKSMSGDENNVQYPSPKLNALILKQAALHDIPLKEVILHSSDVFYAQKDTDQKDAIAYGCSAVEMESFALFANAKALGKQAACLATVSDSFVYDEIASAKERETCMNAMIELALESAAAFEE
jgi:purine-nucleoside phosphorylase